MLFNRKTALFVSSAILISAFGACSSGVTPVPVSVNGDVSFASSNLVTRISENVTQSKQDPSHFYIDAGKGQTTGASLTVKLNLGNGGFKTKSADGTPAKVISDIGSFDIALLENTTGTAPSGSVANLAATATTFVAGGNVVRTTTASGILAGHATSNSVNGTTLVGNGPTDTTAPGAGDGIVGNDALVTTITFTNVPASTTAKSYWVAAAAKDSAGTANITNASGTINTAGVSATPTTNGASSINLIAGRYYVSTAGGTSGAIRVTADVVSGKAVYHVSSTQDLVIAMTLADALTGASVTSAITVNDGTTGTITTPIAVN